MRIEVDEDPLVRTRRRYHPHASLRRGIRHGVSGRGEVVGGWDSDVASTFICRGEWKGFFQNINKKNSHFKFGHLADAFIHNSLQRENIWTKSVLLKDTSASCWLYRIYIARIKTWTKTFFFISFIFMSRLNWTSRVFRESFKVKFEYFSCILLQ